MFVRFRKAGEWRLKVYLAQSTRRGGKVVQETVAYLGSVDQRHLGTSPDDSRERTSIQARVRFWKAANPKLRALVNRLGGEDKVKRLRMAVHARIPWPMQPEQERLGVLEALAEADDWYRAYKLSQELIANNDKLIATITEKNQKMRDEAGRSISLANKWKAEAETRRQRASS